MQGILGAVMAGVLVGTISNSLTSKDRGIITEGDFYLNDTPLSFQTPHTLNLKTRFAGTKTHKVM